jgi:hypothetical protein
VIDVVLGAALLAVFGADTKRKYAYAAVLLSIAATFAVAQTFDPQKLASSVYRSGRAQTSGAVLEVADGKTATISVEKDGDRMLIKTNGKTDATANVNPAGHFAADEPTMALIGALPLLIHDAPRRVANIGFGSGLTSNIILADPRVLHLDTIEIEPKIVELARHFDPLNRSVYTDSRSAIRIEDAKSFFAANGQTYDLIVSEPSNPWVSGVSSLFSVEFYRHVSRYLNKDGLFAQWLQIYETHPDRVMSVLKAMSLAFDDYIVIAMDDGDSPPDRQAAWQGSDATAGLRQIAAADEDAPRCGNRQPVRYYAAHCRQQGSIPTVARSASDAGQFRLCSLSRFERGPRPLFQSRMDGIGRGRAITGSDCRNPRRTATSADAVSAFHRRPLWTGTAVGRSANGSGNPVRPVANARRTCHADRVAAELCRTRRVHPRRLCATAAMPPENRAAQYPHHLHSHSHCPVTDTHRSPPQ